MKKSFITTVYNEEQTIRHLLNSLLSQTVTTDEIVFVDAGSTDNTVKIITQYSKKFNSDFKIFIKKGNRSVGRNYAIKKASGDIIAVTDAGCVLQKDWFEKITYPFKDKSIDVVAGFYRARVNNVFEKCLSTYTCVMPEKVTGDFLPSSRSIAFKKSAWREVGGYPKHLNTCEDLVFATNLKRKGLKFYVEKKAIVFWPQRKNLYRAFLQFFSYAKGDGEAHFVRTATPLLYARFLILMGVIISPINLTAKVSLLLFLFILYSIWSIQKNYKYVKEKEALILLLLLQVSSDIAVFSGMTYGYVKSIILK